jgi:DNA-binding CsgD family transcriptional regulator
MEPLSRLLERAEGAAFFRAAKDLYRLRDMTYVCVNIPIVSRKKSYMHCLYSDSSVKQCMSEQRVDAELMHAAVSSVESKETHGIAGSASQRSLILALCQRVGETAVFGLSTDKNVPEWEEEKQALAREVRILASYFHAHVLRLNGYDSRRDILMSAKELDCLKWTAAGKTAWEASVILGICERTVRFHLNSAREKLNCVTTTQAVAKAIASQLIDVEGYSIQVARM